MGRLYASWVNLKEKLILTTNKLTTNTLTEVKGRDRKFMFVDTTCVITNIALYTVTYR